VPVNLPISCEVPNQGSVSGILVDVSMGGGFISAEIAPAFGAELTIVGDFPGARGARLPVVVRWSKPGGFGVQFGLMGARETHALNTLIHSRGA
jgi:type IV pilus assembly protein PilZ